jgi:HlyD family secretion protein
MAPPRRGREGAFMKKKWLKWFLIIAGILLVLFVGAKVIGGGADKSEKVITEKVTKRTIIETVNASGKVYPEVEVKISPDISGEVVELNVQEGDSVRRGQVLARIFAETYSLQRDDASARVAQSQATVANNSAAIEALKATVTQNQQNYDRNKSLFDQKVISQSELEQFETSLKTSQANYNAQLQNIRGLGAGVKSAQTGLRTANTNLNRATIVAPMDGVISLLSIKKGEKVAGNSFNVGTEMMRVADMKTIEVRVDVGENDVVKVNIGDSVDVDVDAYKNRKFKGVVTQIASSTKSAGSLQAAANDVTNYEVKIRLDASSYQDLIDPKKPKKFPFRPGMNASADIKTKRKENVLSVPVNAVGSRLKGSDKTITNKKEEENKVKKDEEETADKPNTTNTNDDMEEIVFVLQKDGTVKKAVVKSGIQDITYIEIETGLKEGDEIISGPYNAISKTLKDGARVKVVTKDKLFAQ